MRTKAPQSRFVRVVTTPIRMLCKARDFYVRSLTNCSMGVSYGRGVPSPCAGQYSSALPRSLSAVSTRSNDSEDYRELLRAASVRSHGHINELDMYMKEMKQQQLTVDQPNNSSKVLPKSCSVGMGFMGRIDEDKAYEEVSEDVKPDLYPRSRSYAVGKGNGASL